MCDLCVPTCGPGYQSSPAYLLLCLYGAFARLGPQHVFGDGGGGAMVNVNVQQALKVGGGCSRAGKAGRPPACLQL